MKYFCTDCKEVISKAVEYTGQEKIERGIKVKEIRHNIVFIPTKLAYERKDKSISASVSTIMYHNPCIQKYRKQTYNEVTKQEEDTFEVDLTQPKVVLI